MDEKIIVALIAFAGGVFGSLFAPWATWGVEQRKQRLQYRRELIVKRRAMLQELRNGLQETLRKGGDLDYIDLDMHHLTFRYRLENHPDFPSLRPYIPFEATKEINEVAYE